ncbi:unnamed protein product [Rotaria sp. Silwood2]|nr:unnamed protein product [Rotaria sp. Silwood2]
MPPKYPLFNSIAIQSMIHNIPTLSSPFYLFDDDIVIRKRLPVTTIIDANKSIVYLGGDTFNIRIQPHTLYDGNIHTAINMGLRKRSADLLKSKGRYFIASHGPLLLYREIGIKIWNEFRVEMNSLISHPFRMPADPSIQTLYIYVGYSNYYTFLKARKMLRFVMLDSPNLQIIRRKLQNAFSDQLAYFICINDDLPSLTAEIQNLLNKAYETIFSKRCSFES